MSARKKDVAGSMACGGDNEMETPIVLDASMDLEGDMGTEPDAMIEPDAVDLGVDPERIGWTSGDSVGGPIAGIDSGNSVVWVLGSGTILQFEAAGLQTLKRFSN